MKLSVVLATYNEASTITACIKSCKSMAGEIIVVDGESTDNTVATAQKLGAQVYRVENKAMFHTNKQIALEKATGDWVLQLDADEEVDDELKKSIQQVVGNEVSKSGFYLKRKNFFLGTWLKK